VTCLCCLCFRTLRLPAVLLDDRLEFRNSPAGSDSFETELRQYLGVTVNQDATTFDFWHKHEKDLPVLSVTVKIYLTLSPGSVPVECLFSTAGLFLNSKRSSMAPYEVDMATFIHDNYDLFHV